jgi:5'-nucleotidase
MPADCIKFALLVLMKSPPDLIVSGPNLGTNAGVHVFYSGTVAAALEGGFYGVPSVAVSTSRENEADMSPVAAQAVRVLRLLLDSGLAPGAVVNVNIPLLSGDEPEIRVASQSTDRMIEEYQRFRAPRGRVYYFLDAAKRPEPPRPGSDLAALEAGAISVTPLRRDLTDEAALPRLGNMLTAVRAKTYD